MDRLMNSKNEKEAIYKIYRACRLCGAGAGYKMPIIQNVVDMDGSDVELKQKIRECVQIEVHQDDKMPPLICELCVDKVNDFYEFLEMCRQTNKRTRLRLGLPPQTLPQGAPDAGDCILGVTEPVYPNDEDEPLSKQKKTQKNVKIKKEPEVRIKIENNLRSYRESRSSSMSSKFSRSGRRAPSPRPSRHTRNTASDPDDVSLSRLQAQNKKSQKTPTKGILKKEKKSEDTSSLLMPRLAKRHRDKEPLKPPVPSKKVKISIKPLPPRSSVRMSGSSSPAPTSRPSRAQAPPRAPRPPPPATRSPSPYACVVCVGQRFKTGQAVANHLRTHVAYHTNPKLACNACGEWFTTADEAKAHHRQHLTNNQPYNCRRCTADFKDQQAYTDHFDKNLCIPWHEEPDVQCPECWRYFVTDNLRSQHKCPGEDGRPGGKCSKCSKNYTTLKSLRKHESNCTSKKKGELIVDPKLLGRLRPIQVRVARCDSLLTHVKEEHFDVSAVTPDYGLDRTCVYPYISSVRSMRIKTEPSTGEYDGMVNIKDEIKDEFDCEENYIHWDSDSTNESDEEVTSMIINPFAKKKRVDSLATLTLKTIFSQRCLGKVPRKRRKMKVEKENAFDSLFSSEIDSDVRRGIDNIIDNLCSDGQLDQPDSVREKEDDQNDLTESVKEKEDDQSDLTKSVREKQDDQSDQTESVREKQDDQSDQTESVKEKEDNQIDLTENVREKEEDQSDQTESVREKEADQSGLTENVQEKKNDHSDQTESVREKEDDQSSLTESVREKEDDQCDQTESVREKEDDRCDQTESIREKEDDQSNQIESVKEKEDDQSDQTESVREKEDDQSNQIESVKENEKDQSGKVAGGEDANQSVSDEFITYRDAQNNSECDLRDDKSFAMVADHPENDSISDQRNDDQEKSLSFNDDGCAEKISEDHDGASNKDITSSNVDSQYNDNAKDTSIKPQNEDCNFNDVGENHSNDGIEKDRADEEEAVRNESSADTQINDQYSDKNGEVPHENDNDKEKSVGNINDSVKEPLEEREQSVENCETLMDYLEGKEDNTTGKNDENNQFIGNSKDNEMNIINESSINNEIMSDSDVKPDEESSNTKSVINGQSMKNIDRFNIDDLEDISETEMDDSKLMEALDAEIGEENNPERLQEDNTSMKSEREDKITLEDLLPDKTEKPLELDSITEFNFDT